MTGTTHMLRRGWSQLHSLKAMTEPTVIQETEKTTHGITARCARSLGFVSQARGDGICTLSRDAVHGNKILCLIRHFPFTLRLDWNGFFQQYKHTPKNASKYRLASTRVAHVKSWNTGPLSLPAERRTRRFFRGVSP